MRQSSLSGTTIIAMTLLGTIVFLMGCGGSDNRLPTPTTTVTGLAILPNPLTLRAGTAVQLSVSSKSGSANGGSWSVLGGDSNGTISSVGLYTAPAVPPAGTVTVAYLVESATATAQLTVQNPTPVIAVTSPTTITSASTPLTVIGSGFVIGSVIIVNGAPVTTHFVDSSHLSGTLSLGSPLPTSIGLQVSNPDPGSVLSASLTIPVNAPTLSVSPAVLSPGSFTVSVTASGVGNGSLVALNGQVLKTASVSGNVVTATGYLPPWVQGSVPISVTASDGSTVLGQGSEPITSTVVPFDTAARFSTQAAWGPRPDVVLHIQQVGLPQYISEQLAAPVGSYNAEQLNPIRSFYLNITQGNSLLRLRTAWAFQTFIPGQIWFSDRNKALPWEQTLERDAFGNYRQILLDAASDTNITTLLNLAGNAASSEATVHPNQNFARELMQLFSIGTVMLNPDGTPKLDSTGHVIPAYDENTVIDMTRLLTGWNYAPPVDPFYTYAPYEIDFSQALTANEAQHDSGSKLVFGNVAISASQSAEQDRKAAIEAIMNHPNTAPFVSRLLIQRFTKSQPSPAYVERVAQVFQDNGKGVNGDLAAVITAILLDPEARAGDSTPDPSDGVLQDPIYQQAFLMSVLQISGEDDQPTYIPKYFSEFLWNPGTVFGYFSPSYVVPGTKINSPEFQLLTNFTDIQRSQFLWSVVTRQQPGFNNGFNGWLYDNFSTVPSMVEAINHLLYHGTMSSAEKTAIEDYCDTISDPELRLESAVFLGMNADSYLVSQ